MLALGLVFSLSLDFQKYLLLFIWDSSCCYDVYYIINFCKMLQHQAPLFHINISKKWKWQWIRFRKWVFVFNLFSSSNKGIKSILRTPFCRCWHSNSTLVYFCKLLLSKPRWKRFSQSFHKIWWHSSPNIHLHFHFQLLVHCSALSKWVLSPRDFFRCADVQ